MEDPLMQRVLTPVMASVAASIASECVARQPAGEIDEMARIVAATRTMSQGDLGSAPTEIIFDARWD